MIYICAYRDWAIDVFNEVNEWADCILIKTAKDLEDISSTFSESDKIFFIGWSWIVSDKIIKKYECICMHPSPLPKYRGGSPIQHQIINGERLSAVTFFKMTDKLDAGEIIFRLPMSLEGELKDVTNRMIPLVITSIFYILNNKLQGQLQDEEEATYFKRRKPIESEIKYDDIKNKTAEQLYNKIRSLQDPYPNAYIVCKDGKKLYLKTSNYEK